jgi:hypothetical protein
MYKDDEVVVESAGLFAIKKKDLAIVCCNTNFLICNGKKTEKDICGLIDWKKRASVVVNHKWPILDENNVVIGLISHATDVTGTIVEGVN